MVFFPKAVAICFWNQHKKYEYYVQVHAAWEKNLLGASFLSTIKEIRAARSRAQCLTKVCCSEQDNNDQLYVRRRAVYRGLAAARFVTSFHQEKLESRVGGKSKVRWACGPLPRAGNGHGGEHAAVVVCLSICLSAAVFCSIWHFLSRYSCKEELRSWDRGWTDRKYSLRW